MPSISTEVSGEALAESHDSSDNEVGRPSNVPWLLFGVLAVATMIALGSISHQLNRRVMNPLTLTFKEILHRWNSSLLTVVLVAAITGTITFFCG